MKEEAKITRMELARSIVDEAAKDGSLVEGRDPRKAARALEKMAEGIPWRQIMREEGIGWYTLVGLRARHKDLVERRRELIATDAMELLEGMRMLQHEKMRMLAEDETMLKRANIRDLAMSYGMYADKFFMATDGNKVVVEHKTSAPSIEDARKAIEAARAKLKEGAIDIDVSHEKENKG